MMSALGTGNNVEGRYCGLIRGSSTNPLLVRIEGNHENFRTTAASRASLNPGPQEQEAGYHRYILSS
jgi:hypothetical protein